MRTAVLIITQKASQGSNLSNYLRKEIQCSVQKCDFHESFKLTKGRTLSDVLYLWDYLIHEVDYLWWFHRQAKYDDSKQSYFALYNVSPGTGSENQFIEFGVNGIFYENQDLTILKKGIHAILAGELWYPRKIITKYIKHKFADTDQPERKSKPHLLTAREEEILDLIASGKTNVEIAESLFISPSTVKTHIYNLFQKIHVQNRVQAAIWASGKMNMK